MIVAVILPPLQGLFGEILQQQLESVFAHYPGQGSFRFLCRPEDRDRYAQLSSALAGVEPLSAARLDCTDLLDLLPFGGEARPLPVTLPPEARAYAIAWDGRRTPHQRPYDDADLHNLDGHIFSRLGPSPDAFVYFPYGYLFRYPGMGPFDKFGLRITQSLAELAARPARHKVVACFGGSAGWSMRCLFHQMYTQRLEALLNEHCRTKGMDLQFTVLNFGQHGNMVLNELMTYTLFCHDLKPDIVVAHDGYNDMVYGLMCDPRLLQDNLAYQENLEGWSQILYNTSHIPRTQNELPYKAVNQPVAALKAYTKRKRQFADTVQRDGGFFVWGLQPAACSKKRRHPAETMVVTALANLQVKPLTSNIEAMYGILIKSLRLPAGAPFVDCHTAFGQYGEEQFLLGDDVHLTPAGDALLGRLYADSIIEHYIGSGRWQTTRQ